MSRSRSSCETMTFCSGEQPLVLARLSDRDRRAEHAVAARDVAEREAVELPAQGLAVQLGHQPADGAREPEVLARALGPGAPAHAARDLQAGDEARDQLRHDVARRPAPGLDAHHRELRAVHDLAAHVLGGRAPGAREPGARLGERAVLVERHLGLGAAELLHFGQLLGRHVRDEHGDAPRRDQHPHLALVVQALLGEQPAHQPRLRGPLTLELPDDGLADLVRQLLDADLDQEGAQRPTSAPAAPARPASPASPPRPSPTTSR